jgi:hypothetical protein
MTRTPASVGFSVEPAAHLVRLVCVRDPTVVELSTAIAGILADPEYRPTFSFLSDCTAIAITPTPNYVRQFVSFMEAQRVELLQGVRWAQVVQPGGPFGMARMGGMLGAEKLVEYKVFTEVAAGERWLASPPTESGDR